MKPTGALRLCAVCSSATGIRAATTRTSRSTAEGPIELAHVDIVGPVKKAEIGRLKCAIMFTASASRLQRVYEIKAKCDALAATRCFIADMGVRGVFRTDVAEEFTCGVFVELVTV